MEETTPAFVCASVAVCNFLASAPNALSFCYLNDSDDMSEAVFTGSGHVLRVNCGHILACSRLIRIHFGRGPSTLPAEMCPAAADIQCDGLLRPWFGYIMAGKVPSY